MKKLVLGLLASATALAVVGIGVAQLDVHATAPPAAQTVSVSALDNSPDSPPAIPIVYTEHGVNVDLVAPTTVANENQEAKLANGAGQDVGSAQIEQVVLTSQQTTANGNAPNITTTSANQFIAMAKANDNAIGVVDRILPSNTAVQTVINVTDTGTIKSPNLSTISNTLSAFSGTTTANGTGDFVDNRTNTANQSVEINDAGADVSTFTG